MQGPGAEVRTTGSGGGEAAQVARAHALPLPAEKYKTVNTCSEFLGEAAQQMGKEFPHLTQGYDEF